MDHVDHILIVDDDREIRELVGNYLKKNGLRTTVVADGRQMRSFLDTTPVDLIVLDIMMPGDDGLQLCRELRVGKHKATPILMLTARNDETASSASKWAPTTTWSSPSPPVNCWPASTPCCGAPGCCRRTWW
jgi:CheY-like chemotaxis protein